MAENTGILASLETLDRRQRMLLSGLIVFVALVVNGGVALVVKGVLDDAASRVTLQKEKFDTLQDLGQEYATAMAQIEAAEKRGSQFAGQALPAYLERVAKKIGVDEQLSVTRTGSEESGGVTQTRYKVELKQIALDLGLNLIHEMETSGYPLDIETSRIRTNKRRDETWYTFTFEVVTFTLEGA
ncbi:MAG: hypothetical protein EP330_25510 [Deltaproteobacteria bacterium]|nr:MAG: hypothetical protein EP330_25510 [Deltaproteobacteria bacterium]